MTSVRKSTLLPLASSSVAIVSAVEASKEEVGESSGLQVIETTIPGGSPGAATTVATVTLDPNSSASLSMDMMAYWTNEGSLIAQWQEIGMRFNVVRDGSGTMSAATYSSGTISAVALGGATLSIAETSPVVDNTVLLQLQATSGGGWTTEPINIKLVITNSSSAGVKVS